MRQTAQDILDDLKRLIATASDGQLLQEGVNIAILGRPNVGKSSLLNTLLQEDRAIVTEIPGTTRDTIEAPLNLGGIPLKLIDTAGIHQTADIVEQQGVARSKAYLDRADLLLIMFDSSRSLTEEDRELLRAAKARKSILILNKVDLPIITTPADLYTDALQQPVVQTSLLDGEGVEELKSAVHQELLEGDAVWGDSQLLQMSVTTMRCAAEGSRLVMR